MNLQQIRERIASFTNYLDSDGNIVTGQNVTSNDIDNWINDRYLNEIFPEYAERDKGYYTQVAKTNTWQVSSAVSSSSSGTTLVATGSIFSNGMVDGVVLNDTQSETVKITAYTNTTTVTVDSSIDDWDAGDTIYIFTGVYTFGGDITDWYKTRWVGIKYDTTDKDYTRCEIQYDNTLHKTERGREYNDDSFVESTPKYVLEQSRVNNTPTMAIIIKPIPEVAITDGVYCKYIQRPTELTNDTDIPNLPVSHHKVLVFGGVADMFRKMLKLEESSYYENLYLQAKDRLMKSFIKERVKRVIDFQSRGNTFIRRDL